MNQNSIGETTYGRKQLFIPLEFPNTPKFAKFESPIINMANNFAQTTRPSNIGTIASMVDSFHGESIDEWKEHVLHLCDVNAMSDKIMNKIAAIQQAVNGITHDTVCSWLKDLLVEKTYIGFKVQELILSTLAKKYDCDYSLDTIESKGIDGYIDGKPVSIKPESYKQKVLKENIVVPIIYYRKANGGVYIDDSELS